ncbi:hypothetical protein D3C87_1702370 [compost metagenome]
MLGGVFDQIHQHLLHQGGIGVEERELGCQGQLDVVMDERRRQARQRRAQHLLHGKPAPGELQATCVQACGMQEVGHQAIQSFTLFDDAMGELAANIQRKRIRTILQAAGRSHDPGQGGAQVV